jgi:diamine N-acetyltransferase
MSASAQPDPHLIVASERVAFGPLRQDLVPLYARWVSTLEIARGVGTSSFYTVEAEQGWYDEMARSHPGQAFFTVYDRSDLEPIGTTSLAGIDHKNGTATFGILIGERRGQGLGTATTRLVLDSAFTVLGLHNVDLQVVFSWNRAAIRCYEKAGFREVGRRRGGVVTMGRRFDVVIMDAVADDFTGSVLGDFVPD